MKEKIVKSLRTLEKILPTLEVAAGKDKALRRLVAALELATAAGLALYGYRGTDRQEQALSKILSQAREEISDLREKLYDLQDIVDDEEAMEIIEDVLKKL